MQQWKDNINAFIKLANEKGVQMIMVGGGAVNFHGYQRHSADVDFWIDTSKENLDRLIEVFKAMEYAIEDFPKEVKNREQNISVKFSPIDLNLELITNFSVGKSFDHAYADSEIVKLENTDLKLTWRVLSLQDLITSKIKAARPKDLLDIQELKRIHNL